MKRRGNLNDVRTEILSNLHRRIFGIPCPIKLHLIGIWVSAILNELPPEYSGEHGKLQDWVFNIGESTGRRTEILGFNANDISGSLLLPGTTMKV